MTASRPISSALTNFSRVLWTPEDLVEVRILPGPKASGRPQSFFWPAASLSDPEHVEQLDRLSQAGMHIYAGVLPRNAAGGKTDADCLPGTVLWTDFDDTGILKVDEAITKEGLPVPSGIIDSGHGIHVYWSLEESKASEAISGLVGDLAALLGSDPSVKNPSRIMRIPGFMNWKAPPRPCVAHTLDPDRRYAFEDLREIVPPRAKVSAQAKNTPLPPLPSLGKTPERARKYIDMIPGSGPGGRTTTAFKVAGALCKGFALSDPEALPLLIEWDQIKNTPTIATDYGEGELAKILSNARRHGKQPEGELLNASRVETKPARSIPLSASKPSALREEFAAEARGERNTIPLPWPRLATNTQALRSGKVTVVGAPTGVGKSVFVNQILVHVHNLGYSATCLSLEDRRVDFERRILAHLAGSWDVISDSPETANRREELLNQHEDHLTKIMESIPENPRLPVKGDDGKSVVPPLPFPAVLDWVGRAADRRRLVIVDPLAQIDFDGKSPWRGQADFMRKICGIAADSGASILLVGHTIKRPGRAGQIRITGEDIQGAAEISRLAQTILLLETHDEKSSDVWRPHGCRESVTHERTVIIDKARNARGRGTQIAMTLDGPVFRELGIIAPKQKHLKASRGGQSSDLGYKD